MTANTRAENVVLLDLRERSPVTEFFILATGTSPRQMRTAAEEIQELGKRMGFKAWHTTGQESAKWILVDCVNVVAHFFDSDSRDFYDLELLWGDCPRIDWRKELGLPPAAEGSDGIRTRINFSDGAGQDDSDAEEEGLLESEEGEDDADLEEEGDEDAPIVMELPDESTGSNSVEFVEVDPPTKRRRRGSSIYPAPLGDEDLTEEERGMSAVVDRSALSSDEDDEERAAENQAADDVEAVSAEDLPRRKIRTRPMGGVSASMSSTSAEDGEKSNAKRSTTRRRSPRPVKTAARVKAKSVATAKPAAKRKKVAVAKLKSRVAPKAIVSKKQPVKKKVAKKVAPKSVAKKVLKKAPAKKTVIKKSTPTRKPKRK
jgi:ribosome-associated protein